MFGKKKPIPQIDKEQLELIKKAQTRINQKKRLYAHFVIFLLASVFLLVFNLVLKFGDETKFLGLDWSVIVVIIWLFILTYHVASVFILSKFLNKDWEEKQLAKLVGLQKTKIESLKKEHQIITPKMEQPLIKTIPNLTLIVAIGEANEIGKDNDLIWHLRNDLKRFKSLTSGHHIIMGRKTFESFPKPLPNRTHIVISRQANYTAPEGVIVVNSVEEAFKAITNDSQPFIIGGGEIYKQALPYTEKLEITKVHANFDADTFFPKLDLSEWKETNSEFHTIDENHKHEFAFKSYERK